MFPIKLRFMEESNKIFIEISSMHMLIPIKYAMRFFDF